MLQYAIRSGRLLISVLLCSGLPSIRTNLSPFTKDFRGGGQSNEPIGNFSKALPLAGCH